MKKLGGLLVLALGLAACGGQQNKVEGESDQIAFNEEVKAALASESESLPAAMIVKVPLGADGKEDPSLAEVRAAKAVGSNPETTWSTAEITSSPADSDKFVVVNAAEAIAPNGTASVAPVADQYPAYGRYPGRTNVDAIGDSTASSSGNNGLIVTGSNNYTFFNQINTNSNLNGGIQDNDVHARRYGYNVRPGIHHQGCFGATWCNNYGWGGYYNYAYRPVYRSWSAGLGGYAGYWGYYTRPARHVIGNNCYYIYGRPAVYGSAFPSANYGWGVSSNVGWGY
jgi:hypothetical protein